MAMLIYAAWSIMLLMELPAGLFVIHCAKEIASVKWKTGIKSRTYGEIPFRFYLKGYADVGYVHNKFNTTGNIFSNKLLYTGGFGLDILTIYDIVLRFEYSFNQLNERAFFFHKNDF